MIKLIFDEQGSDVADELWDRADIVASSRLIYPEARAAVAAAQRSGRIDARILRSAVRSIDDLFGELRVIGVDAELVHEAGDLAERYALRGYDAVHFASAHATRRARARHGDVGSRSPTGRGRVRLRGASTTVAHHPNQIWQARRASEWRTSVEIWDGVRGGIRDAVRG